MEIRKGTLIITKGKIAIVTNQPLIHCGKTFFEARFARGEISNGHISSETIFLCQVPEEETSKSPEELLYRHLPEVIISLAREIAVLKGQTNYLVENKV